HGRWRTVGMPLLSQVRLPRGAAPDELISASLRQELDSMVRVIYLLRQSVEARPALIEACVGGERWRQSGKVITDKAMVDLAQELQGWTASVYKFGCAFIHLSGMHDYNSRDPLSLISNDEREDILRHCRYYHSGPANDDASFADLVPFLPKVLEKIAGNLECYLNDLENDRTLNIDAF
ncbi:hypothetical protein, partial [Pseudoduganella violacea]